MNFPQPLLQSLSHDPLELCLFGAQVYILKTVVLLNYLFSKISKSTAKVMYSGGTNTVQINFIDFFSGLFHY